LSITSINSGGSSSVAATSTGAVRAVNTQADITVTVKNESVISATQEDNNQQNIGIAENKYQPSEDELSNVTEELNQFMQSMNTDIGFALHTRTKTLMVQVEDGKTHKILKEFPAHELLDMVARIRDCIGAFIDKKI